jgi:hypothetical protein
MQGGVELSRVNRVQWWLSRVLRGKRAGRESSVGKKMDVMGDKRGKDIRRDNYIYYTSYSIHPPVPHLHPTPPHPTHPTPSSLPSLIRLRWLTQTLFTTSTHFLYLLRIPYLSG